MPMAESVGMIKLRPGVIENGVLVGRGGYLFLAHGGHTVSDFVTGKREVASIDFDIFRQNLIGRAEWAMRNEAQFMHLIMPDKQSIIPEAWTLGAPIRLGELYTLRNQDFGDRLLYPVDLLSAYQTDALTHVDTHLTAFGSLLVARRVVEIVSGKEQREVFDELVRLIDREVVVPGDLGSKLMPPVKESVKTFRSETGACFSNNVEGSNNGGVDLRFNPKAIYQKRVVIFGDSFGCDVARMLQFWYSEVLFFRSGFFHEEISALCRPDILITENVERYLDRRISDEERPQFLLYPHLNEKVYSPSKEFSVALSAMLSYPRKPYTDFIAKFKPPVKADVVLCYDQVNMVDPPWEAGVLKVLEQPARVARRMPEFVADFSGAGLEFKPTAEQHIHGSYLVQRQNVLLFGPNHLVSPEGYWSCKSRSHKRQFLSYLNEEFYGRMYPGPKPEVDDKATELLLKTSQMAPADVEVIETPLFLATPLEPPIWGRWIATVASKVAQFRQYGAGRRFFCHIEHDWQRAFLNLLGVDPATILQHDAGRTYVCRDVMTVEYSDANMTISSWERLNFFEMVAKHKVKTRDQRKIFVSRLSRSKANPSYRVLQNEDALASMLEGLGFVIVEPETLPFEVQISIFAAAEQVVFLGGSAVFNGVFCAPDTSVVTIEASDKYVAHHAELLASLDLRYGVIFGAEDAADPAKYHKRWTVDVARVEEYLNAFFM